MTDSFEQYVKKYYRYAMSRLSLFSRYNGSVGYVNEQTEPSYDEFLEELEEPILGELPVTLKENAPIDAYFYIMDYYRAKYPELDVFKSKEELEELYNNSVYSKAYIDELLDLNIALE